MVEKETNSWGLSSLQSLVAYTHREREKDRDGDGETDRERGSAFLNQNKIHISDRPCKTFNPYWVSVLISLSEF